MRKEDLKIRNKKIDEADYFLELIEYADKTNSLNTTKSLRNEANELLSIYVASIKIAKS